MMWGVLSTAIQLLFTGLSGAASAREEDRAKQDQEAKSRLDRKDRQRSLRLQEDLTLEQLDQSQQRLDFQKSEAAKSRDERNKQFAEQKRQTAASNIIGLFGNNLAMQDRLNNMFAKTGFIGG